MRMSWHKYEWLAVEEAIEKIKARKPKSEAEKVHRERDIFFLEAYARELDGEMEYGGE